MGVCPDAVCNGDEIRNASSTQPNLYHVKLIDPRMSIINGSEEIDGDSASPSSSFSSSSTESLMDARLLLPFRFAQNPDGSVANVFFVRGDDVEEILNYKRTIIGAFQV